MTREKTGQGNGGRATGDVTGSKPPERDLRGLEEQWRSLVENIPDIIITVDADGTILFINHTLSGQAVEGVVGASVYDFAPPEQHDALRKRLERVFDRGQAHSFEMPGPGPFGRASWYFSRIGPIVRGGRVVAAALITTDITERKRAEEALQESEQKYRDLVETVNETIYEMDASGRITYVSPVAEQAGDFRRSEMIGRSLADLIHPDDLAGAMESVERSLRGELGAVEFRILTKSGEPRWHRSVARPVMKDGRAVGLRGVLTDLTERKRADEVLRESRERYRGLVEDINDIVFALDATGRLTYISPAVTDISGHSPSEMVGRPFTDFIHPDDVPSAMERFRRSLSEDHEPIEMRFVSKSGEIHWLRSFGRPILNGDRVVGLRGVQTDITQRKRAEQALRESEERFRQVAATAREWISELDAEGRYTYSSPAVKDILGYEPEEVIGKHFYDFYTPEDRKQLLAEAREIGARKKTYSGATARNVHKDGHTVVVESSGLPILDTEGNVLGYRNVGRDITERKRAEEALRESEAKYRDLVENINDVIYEVDATGRITYVSRAAEGVGGYSRSEIIGRFFTEFFHPDDLETFVENFQRAVSTGVSNPNEYRLKSKTGETLWFRTNGRPILEGERVVGFRGVLTGITESKRAEQALQESEQKYRDLVETVNETIYEVDASGRITYISPVAEQAGDYRRSEMIGRSLADLIHPDDLAAAMESVERSLRGEIGAVEFRILTKSGEPRWHRSVARPVMKDGRAAGLRGVLTDLTEGMRAEESLRESEARYRDLVENINDVIYEVDATGRMTYVSPVVEETLGYSQSELTGRNFAEFIHPEDFAHAVDNFARNSYGNPDPIEVRVVAKSGEVHWVRSFGRPILKGDRAVGVRGVLTFITKRKRAEEALRESEEQFRLVTEAVPVLISYVDSQQRYRFNNKAYEEWFGRPRAEVQGQLVRDVVGDSAYETIREHIESALSGQEVTFESSVPYRDGGARHVSAVYVPDVSEEGEVRGFVALVTDITERRRAEEALREREETMRALLNAPTESALLVDLDGTILALNDIAARRLGKSVDDLVGSSASDLFPPDVAAFRMARIEEVVRSSEPCRFEDTREDMSFDVTVYPIFDADGTVVRVAVFASDITERKEMEEALQRTREELESKVERQMQRGDLYGLTFRELTVLHLVVAGGSDKEIGTTLGISTQTASKHIVNILRRMRASSRTEAGVRALKEGLLD